MGGLKNRQNFIPPFLNGIALRPFPAMLR